ncbi:TIGR04282 family arsenosugar biosynthesis glycosyltransferase [Luteimicrobium subarcticum]|uniref:2-phospho-L-lactate guanylyltransferase n=1 Tax=Luteimicrobium subarcticum TaxID=620910 RepID=A0A2M8W1S3_9MICO|nr:DUF2064 domain-containing protein [Luteimicrobium subarcticum]PJI84883.1 hypothetical protein CLV34_3130 [Luteimicrobium subarcticum]
MTGGDSGAAGPTLVVVAKECVPGRVKTRLHPPLTLDDAAAVARACLADTLRALADVPAARRVLFLDGRADDPLTLPPEAAAWDVLPQPHGTLDVRLGHLLDVVDGPLLLVGMDTPQLTAAHLAPVTDPPDLDDPTAPPDVWLGPAADGGYWALATTAGGADRARRLPGGPGSLVRGVPMSRADTGALQRARIEAHGLRVGRLAALVDVDTADDLRLVLQDARPGGALAGLAEPGGVLDGVLVGAA